MASSTDIAEMLAFEAGFKSGFLAEIRHEFGDDYEMPENVGDALSQRAVREFTKSYDPTDRD